MKKQKLVTIIFLFITFIGLPSAFCINLKYHAGISLGLGMYDFKDFAGSGIYTDANFMSSGYIRFYPAHNWGIIGRYSWYRTTNDYPRTGYYIGEPGERGYRYFGTGDFKLKIKPASLGFIYHFKSLNKNMTPFVEISAKRFEVDYIYYHDEKKTDDYESFSVRDIGYGMGITGGLEFFSSSEFSVRLEIEYMRADTDIEIAPNPDPVTGEFLTENIDLSGFRYGVVFTYYFKPLPGLKKGVKKTKAFFELN